MNRYRHLILLLGCLSIFILLTALVFDVSDSKFPWNTLVLLAISSAVTYRLWAGRT